ncbi:uncharacterized protein ACN427_009514 [Glossina fuscipes fuscipes]
MFLIFVKIFVYKQSVLFSFQQILRKIYLEKENNNMVQELCRVCATAAHEDTAIKLFERNQKELLQQLRLLTGSMIKNSIGYPRLVCWACQQKLMDAYAFRQCFVKSQLFFKEKMREKLIAMQEAKKFKEKTRTPKDSELFPNTVKEEEGNDNNDRKKEDHEEVYESSEFENVLKEEEHQGLSKDDIFEAEEEEFINIDQKIESNFSVYEFNNEDEPDGNVETMNNASVEKKSPERLQLEKKKTFKGRKKRKNAPEEPRQYICDQCGNHFSCRHHFVIHLRRHTGDKQYACEICPDKFFTNSELTRHMRKHTGERPFACKFCLRKFTDYSTRVKHERTHTNERPFQCNGCGKSFTTSYILKNHMLTHTGEKLFSCNLCNRSFSRRTHLVVHYRSILHKQAEEKQAENAIF